MPPLFVVPGSRLGTPLLLSEKEGEILGSVDRVAPRCMENAIY